MGTYGGSVVSNNILLAMAQNLYKRVFTYTLDNSFLAKASGDYVNKTPAVTGNRRKFIVMTYANICNDAETTLFGGVTAANTDFFRLSVTSDGVPFLQNYTSGAYNAHFTWSVNLRDYCSFVPVLLTVDTSQVTQADRFNLYVGWEFASVGTTYVAPAQDLDCNWNYTALPMGFGTNQFLNHSDCYHSQSMNLDGVSIQSGDFAISDFYDVSPSIPALNVPKDLSAFSTSKGTNGVLLEYAGATLGVDSFGGSDWTVGGTSEQTENTPTNRHCIWNALEPSGPTLSNGNRTMTAAEVHGTLLIDAGKFAWTFSATSNAAVGVEEEDGTESTITSAAASTDEFFLDADAGTLSYKRDGGSLTSIATGLTGPYRILSKAAGTLATEITPTEVGYKTLCTENFSNPDLSARSGSYTANGSADGPYIPSGVMTDKVTIDSVVYERGIDSEIDFTAGGFKLRTAGVPNDSGVKSWSIAEIDIITGEKYAQSQAN